ncbi:MAG: hypothetical protein ACO1N0_16160 [Fluviicola sp.]
MKTILGKFIKTTLIIACVLTFLGFFLIRGGYFNLDIYLTYFVLALLMLTLSIGLIVLFGIVLLVNRFLKNQKATKEEFDPRMSILTGNRYKINLDTIRIKSNNWESSRFIENRFYDIEIKEKNIVTILEFDVEIRGKKETFHWPSEMEPKSLEMYFAIQKETDFYLDPEDHSKFYLDLTFIS